MASGNTRKWSGDYDPLTCFACGKEFVAGNLLRWRVHGKETRCYHPECFPPAKKLTGKSADNLTEKEIRGDQPGAKNGRVIKKPDGL